MSTSVKLDKEDKERLDKLQALVTVKAGKKRTQQEILSTLIGEAYARSDEFVEKLIKADMPMPDGEYEKILSLMDDWGVETSWREIDETLYGTKEQRRG